jgi:large subunit ribosomal protein L25
MQDRVRLNMPVHFLGTPRGAAHGGLLEVLHGEVPILCPASSIPKYIEVEVTKLEVGDSIRYRDLTLPEGAELTAHADIHVVKCAQARRSEESTTAGAAGAAAAPTAATVPSAKGAPPKKEEPKK